MLPGFRFLFAAIVLSISMLIFGLGAVALLRAAHQEFASIPRRAPSETVLAQRTDTAPSLAMLRVDASSADEVLNPQPTENVQVAAPASEQPALAPAPPEPERPATEPDKVAALTDVAPPAENSPASEAAAPETAAAEISSQTETPAPAATPSPVASTSVAAIAEMPPAAADQASVTAPDQPPLDDSARIAETKIATLGGPPVLIETQRPPRLAPAALRKTVQARRTVKRRRIVQRAPAARPPAQQPPNPFGTRLGG